MPAPLVLSERDARRLAVGGQLLSGPRPVSVMEVVTRLGMVQMDPVRPVGRTEHLVLWSRLGPRFKVSELERLLWEERSLFEYWAFIVPTADFGVHREAMRRYPASPVDGPAHRRRAAEFLEANAAFRRHILGRLRREGPLRTRDLEDRSATRWPGGGWKDDEKQTGLMLEVLWGAGQIMIVGRDGQQRIWDLASRRLPFDEPRVPPAEVARRIVNTQLRALGVAEVSQFGFAFGGRAPGWERALAKLVRGGAAVPVRVAGLTGEWYAHADVLSRPWRARTTLLSPFDQLIHDRNRTEAMFGFRYRLEMYVPKTKREFGYYVLPILHGDRLIGRLDPILDRRTAVLTVNGVWAEPGAPADAGNAVSRQIDDLAAWSGASDVRVSTRVPTMWRSALRG